LVDMNFHKNHNTYQTWDLRESLPPGELNNTSGGKHRQRKKNHSRLGRKRKEKLGNQPIDRRKTRCYLGRCKKSNKERGPFELKKKKKKKKP